LPSLDIQEPAQKLGRSVPGIFFFRREQMHLMTTLRGDDGGDIAVPIVAAGRITLASMIGKWAAP